IRSGYTQEELLADSYLTASLEAGLDVLQLTLLFSFALHPFVFTDQGVRTQGQIWAPADSVLWADAYGGGVKLRFLSPVNTEFEFSFGINRNGEYRFYFQGGSSISDNHRQSSSFRHRRILQ
ncbi:MAG: hypothetical protein ACLFR1_15850, partial [Spirochaetia bacterium]